MQKVIVNTHTSASHNIDFKVNKPAYTQPGIIDSYVDEDTGEVMHNLDNGRTQSDVNYMKIWGRKKGVIVTDKKYKGENPCKKNHWLK